MNTIKLNTIGTPFPKAEGGGGDTPSGGGNWQYFSIPSTLDDYIFIMLMTMYPTFVKMAKANDGVYHIGSAGILALSSSETAKAECIAIGIDMDAKVYMSNLGDAPISFAEYEVQSGQSIASGLASFGCTEITEEEFYNLETA